MQHLYEKATELSRVGIWHWNPLTNKTIWFNNKFRLFGYEPNEFEITIDSAFKTVHPDDVNYIFKILEEKLPTEDVFEYEYRGIKKDGSEIFIWVRAEVERDNDGNPIRVIGISQDITARRHLEDEIKSLNNELEEKVKKRTRELELKNGENELLLKELHHRVKNNLMVTASLLNLQAHEEEIEEAASALKTASQRVKTIGLMHKVILGADQCSKISTIEYFKLLFESIIESSGKEVNINVKANIDLISLDKLTYLGLVLNELCMNSVKHTFADKVAGELNFEINSSHNLIEITYSDGSDLKERVACISKSEGLGTILIEGLVCDQLNGSIAYDEERHNILIKIPIQSEVPA